MSVQTVRWYQIAHRHYVLNPRTHNSWIKLSHWRLEAFRTRFGDDFCLVVTLSPASDAYVIPYAVIKALLYGATRPAVTMRWDATIVGGELRVAGRRFPVSRFHNFFELLDLVGPVSEADAA